MTTKQKNSGSILKILVWPFKSYIRILLIVIVAGIFQYQSIQIDILAREVRELELRKNELLNQRATLQADVDRLTHINRIERLAGERFDLVAPGEDMERLVIRKHEYESPVRIDSTNQNLHLAGVK